LVLPPVFAVYLLFFPNPHRQWFFSLDPPADKNFFFITVPGVCQTPYHGFCLKESTRPFLRPLCSSLPFFKAVSSTVRTPSATFELVLFKEAYSPFGLFFSPNTHSPIKNSPLVHFPPPHPNFSSSKSTVFFLLNGSSKTLPPNCFHVFISGDPPPEFCFFFVDQYLSRGCSDLFHLCLYIFFKLSFRAGPPPPPFPRFFSLRFPRCPPPTKRFFFSLPVFS